MKKLSSPIFIPFIVVFSFIGTIIFLIMALLDSIFYWISEIFRDEDREYTIRIRKELEAECIEQLKQDRKYEVKKSAKQVSKDFGSVIKRLGKE